jgi:hypothetical protein
MMQTGVMDIANWRICGCGAEAQAQWWAAAIRDMWKSWHIAEAPLPQIANRCEMLMAGECRHWRIRVPLSEAHHLPA